jgi:Rap1a immunity proteins
MTGNEFLRRCQTKTIEAVQCMGYVRGLADGLILWKIARQDDAPVCIPPQAETQQLLEVAARFIRANPKTRHEEAGMLLGLAFLEAWPCNNANAKQS